MGAWGAIIMSFFGAVFASTTLRFQFHRAGISFTSPFLIFAGIAGVAAWAIRQPGRGISTSERASRVIMWSSIAENACLWTALEFHSCSAGYRIEHGAEYDYPRFIRAC